MRMNATKLENRIVFEDNHLLVIDKNAGELVQGDQTGDACLLDYAAAYIKEAYQKPGNVFVGLPHRLDRPTSGLVVLAKTSKALARLNALFKERETQKIYHCLVSGKIEQKKAELIHFLQKNAKQNKSYPSAENHPQGKKAVLTYTVLQEFDRYSLLEIELHTGRHHQIRAQLAAIGHPIKGDVKYGARRPNADGNICLHAQQISFLHPVRKEPLLLTSKRVILEEWGMVKA